MMNHHPLAPEEFTPIQTEHEQSGRHHRRAFPKWLIVTIPSLLTGLALGGLAWLIVNRQPNSPAIAASTESSVTATSRDPAHTHPAASPPAKFSARAKASQSSPRSKLNTTIASGISSELKQQPTAKIKTGADIYESELPVHGHNSVDDEVFLQLIDMDILPAKRCSDEVFLRRVYLDTIGTLPTAGEARYFIDNHEPDKRAVLIDELLERPEFADYWAMKWCDVLRVKAEFPINLWPNAAQAYHRWIRNSIKHNVPYDQFAYELLTASGSNFRTPQVNFYRALQSKDPSAIAEVVALTFMCERTDNWPDARLEGMSQFFCKVGYKPTGEWKEEIVFFDPRREESGSPNESTVAVYPSGARVTIPAGQDPREVFAEWLIHEKNPWFARAVANRVWCWLLGRGIVDPIDDVRNDNPPSNLNLLNHLAEELVASDYDLKHLYRLILDSSAYQLSCIPANEDPRAGPNFAYYYPRRLDAEVLIDAICQITGTTETYMSIIPEPFTFLPKHQRAIALPDGSITSSFLEMYGRPARDTGLESERNNRLTASQSLHLLNSNHIRNKLKNGSALKRLVDETSDSWDTTNMLYLTILSRRPTQAELQIGGQLCDYESGVRKLAWALINSDEFLFRH